MKLSQARIAIALAVVIATSSGCGVINRIRAKNELNEAARTYNEGHFVEAEQHARRALELDPNNKTGPLFTLEHSRAVSSGVTTRDIAKAREPLTPIQRSCNRIHK